ncbi:MAG: 30S ribosomal protein S16 [Pseudomonadota bacterium]|nr:30S ribosomal protein S16 [Pseudomonadota bacterium]
MAVVIRLARFGRPHKPHYRVTVADHKAKLKGRFIEIVGQFDPAPKGKALGVNLNMERIKYWLGVGAQPSDTVRDLIRKAEKASPTN